MRPFFNTAGPCIPGKHHMLPPHRRLANALKLIDRGAYFVLRAGRQTGKTTSARWMVEHLRKTGRYEALWVDLQPARELSDPAIAFPALLDCFVQVLSVHPELPCPKPARLKDWLSLSQTALNGLLGWLSSKSKKPLVLFLDEVDGLMGRDHGLDEARRADRREGGGAGGDVYGKSGVEGGIGGAV